ncbi:unnamed protein product [Ectocarpus sp. 12 AP-2014]
MVMRVRSCGRGASFRLRNRFVVSCVVFSAERKQRPAPIPDALPSGQGLRFVRTRHAPPSGGGGGGGAAHGTVFVPPECRNAAGLLTLAWFNDPGLNIHARR